jgi:integrative and conjugative element protein (TIGR02256 family)
MSTKRVWIARHVLTQMTELASRHAPMETGGMLLGYVSDSNEFVVTAIVGAGPAARHRRLRFRPDYDFQQSQLESHFESTQGAETYLGDWHTHPSGACSLSWLDKRVLLRIAKTPSSGTQQPIMLVLGGGTPEWRLHASSLLRTPPGLRQKAKLQTLALEIFEVVD